jgi:hypothetical protein
VTTSLSECALQRLLFEVFSIEWNRFRLLIVAVAELQILRVGD